MLLTLVDHSPSVRLDPAICSLDRERTLVFSQETRLFRSIGQQEHRQKPKDDRRGPFDQEQESPIRDRRVNMLNPECDEPAECACDGRKAEPECHAHAHLFSCVVECYSVQASESEISLGDVMDQMDVHMYSGSPGPKQASKAPSPKRADIRPPKSKAVD